MGSNKYPKTLKERAVQLRLEGASYSDIMKKLNLRSKGTVSYWLKNIKLTSKARMLLKKNMEVAHKKGLVKANKDRQIKIKLENSNSFLHGEKMMKLISNYDLAILGVSLFWGEGTKYEPKNNPSRSLTFTNSDPSMISVYMRFLREIVKVPENRIRAGIHLYSSMNRARTINFWSKTTGLSKDIFYLVNQVSIAGRGKRQINFLPYGTAVIRVNNRHYFYLVKGMLSGLIKSTNIKI